MPSTKRNSLLSKHFIQLLGVIMILSFILSACGNSNNDTKADSSTPKPSAGASEKAAAPEAEQPLEVSIMVGLNSPEAPKADSEILQKIEAHTKAKLDINWIPDSVYTDKLVASLAANNLTDIVSVNAALMRNAVITNAVKSGVFWEIGPYLDEYPNLKQYDQVIMNNTMYDGKIYSIYRTLGPSASGLYFRQDWLDNLGLQPPKTLDDIYAILKAFTLDDPDKNGQNDTYGLAESNTVDTFLNALVWNGGPNNWGIEDGKLIPAFLSKHYLPTMQFMQKLTKEKLINSDFLLIDNTQKQNLLINGKAGMYIGNMSSVERVETEIGKIDPQAKFGYQNVINPPDPRVHSNAGFRGVYFISKAQVKTEEHLKQVLGFLDRLMDKEAVTLAQIGIEGRHYKIVNGLVEVINLELQGKERLPFNPFVGLTHNLPQGVTPPGYAQVQMNPELPLTPIRDVSLPYESQTYAELGGSLDANIMDARNKFILNELDEAGWNKAVDTWLSSGGDKILQEMDAQMQQAK